jgi:hypothetical protein
MGIKLPVEMCPNLYFHFKPHGGWPTGPAPHSDFSRAELVAAIVETYETIPIEVHEDRPGPPLTCLLMTTKAASAKRHQALTPRFSTATVDNLSVPFQNLATSTTAVAASASTLATAAGIAAAVAMSTRRPKRIVVATFRGSRLLQLANGSFRRRQMPFIHHRVLHPRAKPTAPPR